MDVSGISNFARTSSTQAAPQNAPSFQELNTQDQRARQDSAQPRNAEAAQSLASENSGRANNFDERESTVSASTNNNSINGVSEDSNAAASSATGRSEDFSISDQPSRIDTASPRGSVVDIVV